MIRTLTSKLNPSRASANSSVHASTHSQDLENNILLIKESGIFDIVFYKSQLNEQSLDLIEAIAHYLNIGANSSLDPHPLFDTAFYTQNNTNVDFSTINPLIHFITSGWQTGINPHPLFDVQYYLDEYKDVRKAKTNPLQHFILFGAREHRHPCEFFDAVHYKRKVHNLAMRAYFAAHLKAGKLISFYRRMKTTTIKNISSSSNRIAPYIAIGTRLGIMRWFKNYRIGKISPIIKSVENPLLHFLSQGYKLGLIPFPSFALLYDLQSRAGTFCKVIPRDLTNLQSVPPRFESLAEQINNAKLSSDKLPLLKELIESLTVKKNAQGFLQSKDTIILASHQAAYTGSPMLLLQIARELSAHNFECLLLLEQGGELEKEFNEVAHIINFKYKPDRHQKCAQYLSLLFDNLGCSKPKVGILNSLETGYYAKAVNTQGIKIISLVHELVDSYPPRYLQEVFALSQSIIFAAKFVQDFAHKKIGTVMKSSRESIIPNALLDENFGRYDRDKARHLLRQEINAPENSLVVLACGSPDLRKGIDYFTIAARILITKRQNNSERLAEPPVHFVWLGAGKIEPWSAHYYIDWDLRQENLQSQIHLLAPRKDLRSVFRGADIFVLPSRQDPFPIVVQNAMAAELPIVSFINAGGVPEMVEGGGAKLVPYGDIIAFAKDIEEYLANKQERLEHGQLNARLVAERFNFSDYFAKLKAEINTLGTATK